MSGERMGPIDRVVEAARVAGLNIEVVQHEASTRTAADAAAACGCPVGAIVKSLVFRGRDMGEPVLLLVSGANRVDEARAAAALGEAIERPDAKAVRGWTGFAIGGIPPFGHDTRLRTVVDRDLLGYPLVWAAAGTPNAVFALPPETLVRATVATVAILKADG